MSRATQAAGASSAVVTSKTHAGLRHFQREVDGRPVRYHLRVDPDGAGILLANASAGATLSESGTLIAEGLLDGAAEETIVERLRRAYVGVRPERALADVRRVAALLDELARPRTGYPLRNLAGPGAAVHRRRLRAPLSADVAMPSDLDGRAILRRLWEIGVPQVTLLLPRDAKPDGLPGLVEAAEDLGLIAGVRARATDLDHGDLLERLARAGVDHVDLFWAGPEDALHDRLFGDGDHARAERLFARCHELEVCPVAVLPLLDPTLDVLDGLGSALSRLRIPALVAFAVVDPAGADLALAPAQLPQVATTLEEQAEHHAITLVWTPPIERAPDTTLEAQLAEGPRASGEGAVRVAADGAVLAPVGEAVPAGNLLSDPWAAIEAHASFARLREAPAEPARCEACPGLDLCAAGCPKGPSSWARPAEGGAR